MYVIDSIKTVFLHHNKNAGVFVKDWLKSEYPDMKIAVYKHAPIRCLPNRYKDYRKIGVVRNPFEWYVSFYVYHQSNGYYKNVGFSEYVKSHIKSSRHLISKVQKKNLKKKNTDVYPPKTGLNIGSCTYHYIHFFSFGARRILMKWDDKKLQENFSSICDLDVVLRQEHLRNDLYETFGKASVYSYPSKNTNKHKPFQEYYSDELRALIERKDKHLLEHYGYACR